jgi:hypothetical protein
VRFGGSLTRQRAGASLRASLGAGVTRASRLHAVVRGGWQEY